MSVSGAPSLGTSGSASVAPSDRSRPKATARTSSHCWMDCGTSTGLQNIASAQYPKWLCGPCVSAKRALDKQGRMTTQNQPVLTELKKNQEKYKAMVRNSRLTLQPMAQDKSLHHERKQVLSNMFSITAAARTAVQCVQDVLWLSKEGYIARQQLVKGNTPEEAVSMLMFSI